MQEPISAEEVERRVPVWCALSELYLDTSLTDSDIDYLAQRIRPAGYSVEEVERILCDEVAPVFGVNLLQVAGEWTHWSEAEVREKVTAHLSSRANWFPATFVVGFWRRSLVRLIASDWTRIRSRLTAK